MRTDARNHRHAIVEAANTLFTAEGAEVPLQRIAERAGVSRTTVFRHFPTRPELWAAVDQANLDAIEEHARALRGTPDGLKTLFRFVLDLQQQRRALLSIYDRLAPIENRLSGARLTAVFASMLPESGSPSPLRPGRDADDLRLAVWLTSAMNGISGGSDPADRDRARELLEHTLFGNEGPSATNS